MKCLLLVIHWRGPSRASCGNPASRLEIFFCPFPQCQRSAVSLHRPTVSVCGAVQVILSNPVSADLAQGYLGLQQGSPSSKHREPQSSHSRVQSRAFTRNNCLREPMLGYYSHVLGIGSAETEWTDGAEAADDDSRPVCAPCGHCPAFALKMGDLPGPRFGITDGAEEVFSAPIYKQGSVSFYRVALFPVRGYTCPLSSHHHGGRHSPRSALSLPSPHLGVTETVIHRRGICDSGPDATTGVVPLPGCPVVRKQRGPVLS